MTPPRLVELKCPQCDTTHWVIDCDYRTMTGNDVDYFDRNYRCPICKFDDSGFVVLQKSPAGFLIDSHLVEDYWFEILETNFPYHPKILKLTSSNLESIQTKCLTEIPVVRDRKTIYFTHRNWFDMIEKGDLFLGINSPDNSSNVVRDIPTISKIAGFAVIDSIINSALPGLEIKYQPPPVHLLYRTIPASYRFKESPNGTIDFSSFSPYIDDLLHGFHFFAIKKEGLYWKSVQDCKELGITIPDVFPIEQVKLYSDNSNLIKISELHKEFGADYV